MAQIFPIHSDANRSNAASGPPIATLSRLPDPWTLLRDRRIGASGAPVSLVLVHPQIGVALLDEAARDSAAGADALRNLLARERFGEYFTGELPIVSLGFAWYEAAGLEQRVIAAFAAVPALSIADRDWADAVVEVLLQPGDLAMVPIGPAATPAPIDPDAGGEAPRFSLAAMSGTERPRCDEPESGVNEHLLALVLRKTWRAGGPRRGRTMEVILTAVVASALTAAIGSFAPSQKTEAPVAAARPAEIETAAAPPVAVPPAQAASVPALSPHPRPPPRRIVRQARCADWLHQDRPGGSDYRGPPVAACRGASRRLPALRLF